MRLFGLIGYPLGHSFSKNYFTKKFEEEDIVGCRYELFPITAITDLPGLLKANPGLEGLNITIPYKKDVLSFLAENRIPQGLDACNCISIKNGNLTGYNTDVVGFEKSFLAQWKSQHKKALVLGAGGAAAAVVFVLKKLGIAYKVVGRNIKPGIDLTYDAVSSQLVQDHSVIINTTPLGTYPKVDECPFLPYDAISDQHYLFDLVYNPAKTLFLKKGEERGAIIQNGYDMLVYQAEEAWRIWNMPI
ncbi:shikimate dehydrogenase [soil metagenome]